MTDSGKTYSDRDTTYFNRFTSGYSPYLEKDLDVMLGPFDSIIGQYGPMRICEIGCADGQFSQSLHERFMENAVSFFGLDIARQVLGLYPYKKICGSAFLSPFKNDSFDMICLPATLHHLFPFEDSLSEMKRILAPGGYFYCMEPNYLHPQRYFFMRHAFLYHLYRNTNDVPIHPGKLKETLKHLGFEIIHFQFINLYFKNPSMLQRLQNLIADTMPKTGMNKYLMPWFTLMAKKGELCKTS
jgi:SAM-dependent methyltransferase